MTQMMTQTLCARAFALSKLLKGLVDLTGIEPVTSSMPWKHQKPKLLTVKWLEDGKTGKTGLIGAL